MERRATLLSSDNLFDFFHTEVERAAAGVRPPVSQNAVFYLSNLLVDQARRPADEGDEPLPRLAELRARAVGAPSGEALLRWRQLGDTALMVAGFFREHLERRRVSRGYCETMGRGAYGTLGALVDRGEGSFAQVFGELAARFDACADLLAGVRDEAAACVDSDVVRLYEEWLSTRSPRVAERLRQLGVVVVHAGVAVGPAVG
jgi:hypothetical protein